MNFAHLLYLCRPPFSRALRWRCRECGGSWDLGKGPRFWCHGRPSCGG